MINLRFIVAPSAYAPPSKTLTAPAQQLILPVVDLVGIHPYMHRQLGDGPVTLMPPAPSPWTPR
jgi:hypothetical protein